MEVRDKKLEERMFAAHIQGRSMEPLIPDGSLCLFRFYGGGSRQGSLVLAEDRQAHAFAIKRYKSEKAPVSSDEFSEGEWRHTRIRLESLNPGYPSWDLDPDEEKYRIVAEFLEVIE